MLYWTRIVPDDAVTPNQMIKDQRLDEDLTPIDLVRGQPPTHLPCRFTEKHYKDYPLLLRHLWEIHKMVRENIRVTAQKMKANYTDQKI